MFDRHGNKTIVSKDLGAVLRVLGKLPTEFDMKDIVAQLDDDGNSVDVIVRFLL